MVEEENEEAGFLVCCFETQILVGVWWSFDRNAGDFVSVRRLQISATDIFHKNVTRPTVFAELVQHEVVDRPVAPLSCPRSLFIVNPNKGEILTGNHEIAYFTRHR